MSNYKRLKDQTWTFATDTFGNYSNAQIQAAVLQDIRDELQKLNRVFACPNFQDVPQILREIRRNTAKKKRKKVRK
jgi:Tfp pilus assembly protein PilO